MPQTMLPGMRLLLVVLLPGLPELEADVVEADGPESSTKAVPATRKSKRFNAFYFRDKIDFAEKLVKRKQYIVAIIEHFFGFTSFS